MSDQKRCMDGRGTELTQCFKVLQVVDYVILSHSLVKELTRHKIVIFQFTVHYWVKPASTKFLKQILSRCCDHIRKHLGFLFTHWGDDYINLTSCSWSPDNDKSSLPLHWLLGKKHFFTDKCSTLFSQLQTLSVCCLPLGRWSKVFFFCYLVFVQMLQLPDERKTDRR